MSLILSGTDGISDVDGSASTPALRGTDANTGIFFPAADTIAFSEGGVESMRIDSAGNVGIGVTPNAWGSSWKSLSINTVGALAATTGVTRLYHNAFNNDSANVYRTTAAASMYSQDAGTHQWFYAGSGTAGANISFTEAMRIDSSGNVGIGTSSPRVVSGYKNLTLDGSNSGLFEINTNGTRVFSVYGASNDINLVNPTTTGTMQFYTNNTERMRISSIGTLMVNTTSEASSGAVKIIVNTSSTNTALQLNTGTSGGCAITNNVGNGFHIYGYTGAIGSESYNKVMENAGVGTSIAIGGSSSVSGVGITFPATQNASSNANTLDDYEEGTWSPTDASGAGLTFSVLGAFYVKIGRLVIAQVELTFPSTGSGATATIGGLPFATSSTSVYRASTGGGYNNKNLNYAVYSGNNSTSLGFYNTSGNGIPNSSCSGGLFTFTHIYQV